MMLTITDLFFNPVGSVRTRKRIKKDNIGNMKVLIIQCYRSVADD